MVVLLTVEAPITNATTSVSEVTEIAAPAWLKAKATLSGSGLFRFFSCDDISSHDAIMTKVSSTPRPISMNGSDV